MLAFCASRRSVEASRSRAPKRSQKHKKGKACQTADQKALALLQTKKIYNYHKNITNQKLYRQMTESQSVRLGKAKKNRN